jgi:hypothetical protein
MYTEYIIIIIAIHLRVSPRRPTDLFVLLRFYLFFLLKRKRENSFLNCQSKKKYIFEIFQLLNILSSFPCFYPSSTQTDEDHQRKGRGCG